MNDFQAKSLKGRLEKHPMVVGPVQTKHVDGGKVELVVVCRTQPDNDLQRPVTIKDAAEGDALLKELAKIQG
jgi:hypothetical protein